jgi:hypothetical protein
MTSKEQVFHEKVKPQLEALAALCGELGIPYFGAFAVTDSETRLFSDMMGEKHLEIGCYRILNLLMNGKIDGGLLSLPYQIMAYAQEIYSEQ